MKNNKKIIAWAAALVAALALFAGAYKLLAPTPDEGSKTVVINVIDNNEQKTTYTVKTDAEYLKGAMDEAEGLTYSGEEGEFGYTLYTVNGVTADFNVDSSYWSIIVNGEYGQYGISGQVIADGDTFDIVYTVYK